jgi:hypothetical protein
MRIDVKQMTIYYPKEHRAFIRPMRQAMETPILGTLLVATMADCGLSAKGYMIARSTSRHDTVVTIWRKRNGNEEQEASITSWRGRNLALAITDSASHIQMLSSFDDFVRMPNGGWLPCRMDLVNVIGEAQEVRRTMLTAPAFDVTIPDSIRFFRIPDDTQVEHVQ